MSTPTEVKEAKGKVKLIDQLKAATPKTIKEPTPGSDKMLEVAEVSAKAPGVYVVTETGTILKAPQMAGRFTVYNFQLLDSDVEGGKKKRKWKRLY
jgi:hypothetical protein